MRTRLITVLTAVALLVPALGEAQNMATGDLTVTVNVIAPLTLTQIAGSDLDFGTVAAGVTPTAISPATGVQFQAAGSANTQIVVTHTGDTSLTGAGDPIAFTADFVGNAANAIGGATAVTDGDSVGLSATGFYYFWLGGSLAALPAGQTPGAYTATWTLTVAY